MVGGLRVRRLHQMIMAVKNAPPAAMTTAMIIVSSCPPEAPPSFPGALDPEGEDSGGGEGEFDGILEISLGDGCCDGMVGSLEGCIVSVGEVEGRKEGNGVVGASEGASDKVSVGDKVGTIRCETRVSKIFITCTSRSCISCEISSK